MSDFSMPTETELVQRTSPVAPLLMRAWMVQAPPSNRNSPLTTKSASGRAATGWGTAEAVSVRGASTRNLSILAKPSVSRSVTSPAISATSWLSPTPTICITAMVGDFRGNMESGVSTGAAAARLTAALRRSATLAANSAIFWPSPTPTGCSAVTVGAFRAKMKSGAKIGAATARPMTAPSPAAVATAARQPKRSCFRAGSGRQFRWPPAATDSGVGGRDRRLVPASAAPRLPGPTDTCPSNR